MSKIIIKKCDCCGITIDKNDRWYLRQTKATSNYYVSKNKEYLVGGDLCKKCEKKFDKGLKKLFKEVGFKFEWKEQENE